MNYKEELTRIENILNEKKLEKVRLEERKNNLLKEKEEILKKIKEENIDSKDIDNKINALEIEIQKRIEKCKRILN